MINQIIALLSENWIGALLAIGGIAIGLFGLLRSKASGIIAVQSQDVSLIGRDSSGFPAEIDIRYRGASIPRLTSSTVFIWNMGTATIKGDEIARSDPLRLRFNGSVFGQRIKCLSEESIQATADISQDADEVVCYNFEFLNPKDGFVLEVFHIGDSKHPDCLGTVMNSSKHPQYWGHAWGASSKSNYRIDRIFSWCILVSGLLMCIEGFFDEPISKFLPTIEEPQAPSWLVGILGIVVTVFAGLSLLATRLRIPSSLLANDDSTS